MNPVINLPTNGHKPSHERGKAYGTRCPMFTPSSKYAYPKKPDKFCIHIATKQICIPMGWAEDGTYSNIEFGWLCAKHSSIIEIKKTELKEHLDKITKGNIH